MSEREADQILVERVQQGDKRAFELLVVKYHRKIIRLISRLIRDAAEVEDVAQDAFIKAYRALPSSGANLRFIRGCTASPLTRPRITWRPRAGVPSRPPISTPKRLKLLPTVNN